MSSGITGHKVLKTREVVKPAVYPGSGPGPLAGRSSVRSKVSSEDSQERTKALKNFCRVFIEMVFTQVCNFIRYILKNKRS